jgi:hypothetical protein
MQRVTTRNTEMVVMILIETQSIPRIRTKATKAVVLKTTITWTTWTPPFLTKMFKPKNESTMHTLGSLRGRDESMQPWLPLGRLASKG